MDATTKATLLGMTDRLLDFAAGLGAPFTLLHSLSAHDGGGYLSVTIQARGEILAERDEPWEGPTTLRRLAKHLPAILGELRREAVSRAADGCHAFSAN